MLVNVSLRALLCNLPYVVRGIAKPALSAAMGLLLLTMTASAHADDATPKELEGVGIVEHLGQSLPLDLAFRDETGATVPLRQYFNGKQPVVIALAYYGCPNLCGLLLNGVVQGFKELAWSVGTEFQFVNVSIDPKEASDLAAAKKKGYLETYARTTADHGWHFLVGDEGHIHALADTIGFKYRYDADQQQYAHAAAIFIATPDGKLSRYLYGIEFRPRDLRLALLEATNGKIGTIADRLLMFCYHYDPATRRYSLVATRLMRMGGVVTIAGVALLLRGLRRRSSGRPAC